MRRPIAILLLTVLFAGLGMPVLQAQARTPACCRRAGQHHCSAPVPADGFRSLSDCPFYSHLRALKTHTNSAVGSASVSLLAPAESRRVIAAETRVARQDLANANSQRGPPLS